MKKILVLMLAGIGDSLLVTPFLRGLRQHFPGAQITTLVIYKQVEEMLKRNSDVDTVLHFNFLNQGYLKSLREVYRLRRERFDISFLAYPSNRFRPGLIHFLIGAKERYGHLYDIKRLRSLSFLDTKALPLDENRHTIDENLQLLTLLGLDVRSLPKNLIFPVTKQEEAFADHFLKKHQLTKKHPLIGIHAGSSELAGMMHKRWPKERFAELANRLVEKHKATILLFGGENEHGLKQELASLMDEQPVFVDDTTFFETAALIKKCDAFVTNDTGLHHLASHFNVPSVVVTGHLNPAKTKPLHAKSAVVSAPVNCHPYRIGEDMICHYAGTSRYCLNTISVDEVYRAVEKLL